ncbi:helix-turn-helix domain-containing protein [Seleniivibrio woodruffii]|uniref:AlpA family transcriptional regulator n=1 Tax=Seleniivibrio woodruffii TaxID=1078050 RepID=A0A4R1KC69_9BACT|nr:helix-turn-helix domain-containing protein [Seleniivibrio woodruffii]TCK61543.1 AlpA family transcriptional regulator [Seleniivibrio woodruffii]TVZ35342.1 AlpA family transcriptional regulator [Seleniivibrio woodruffii]
MDKPMNVEEVAIYLHKAVSTIYQMTHKKQIPHIKEGGNLLFDRDDINNWLASKKVPVRKC